MAKSTQLLWSRKSSSLAKKDISAEAAADVKLLHHSKNCWLVWKDQSSKGHRVQLKHTYQANKCRGIKGNPANIYMCPDNVQHLDQVAFTDVEWVRHITCLLWVDDSSLQCLTAMVLGSDSVQLVLKPLCESLGWLVLLIRIGVHGDGMGLWPRQNWWWQDWEDKLSYAACERNGLGSDKLMQPTRVHLRMSDRISRTQT